MYRGKAKEMRNPLIKIQVFSPLPIPQNLKGILGSCYEVEKANTLKQNVLLNSSLGLNYIKNLQICIHCTLL